MSDLHSTLSSVLADCYNENAARIRELADPLSDTQFWQKPFVFGNSFGHLVLHLTGNLNYYIGAQIAKTGYVRDRPREFSEQKPPSKRQTLKRFEETVAMVIRTIQSQSPEDWSSDYSAELEDAQNRLHALVRCAAHLQHHIGQMVYLVYQLQRKP